MPQSPVWSLSPNEAFSQLQTRFEGLHEHEVLQRQKAYGLNILHKRKINTLEIAWRQVTGNPLIIILSIATLISYFLGQHVSAYYIFAMILVSMILGFWNEYSAEKTIDSLLKRISRTAVVVRDGVKKEVPVRDITLGDIVLVSQGSIFPADVRLIETNDLEVNESALTGESKTVHKLIDPIVTKSTLSEMKNIGFMGTNVTNGSGKGVVFCIGKDTEYGKIAKIATFLKPSTEFERGLKQFGNLIIEIICILTVVIFAVNYLLGHPILDSLLFALAIAVGLTPELLPVIVTISLSHGAGKLANKHVIAKQLISIENLGNIDVLCTDKTGTLTEGEISVVDYIDEKGKRSEDLLAKALLCNSAIVHHKILGNGIDVALWQYAVKEKKHPSSEIKKVEEEPFDYNRKAMYTVIEHEGKTQLIVKGAPEIILSYVHSRKMLEHQYIQLSKQGYRVIAVASKPIAKKGCYTWDDVEGVDFDGFIMFLDVPKKTAKVALETLKSLNVEVKIITGDNEIITRHICQEVGLDATHMLAGQEMNELTDKELCEKVSEVTVFARVNPEQKLRVLQALKENGKTVGYMGDGINDIPSLKNADVGISVNTGVDVAKEAATVVLMRKSLRVIADGIMEGRRTFNNTIKYILMATSSNFGNMFSASAASFFLPFLPMTPVQILLTNALYDISQMTIPSDNVDPESLLKPRHWNISFIRSYMLFFGPLSSIYDLLTFGVMLFVFKASNGLFQTGWFIESVATEILVVFVIRTSRTPFFKSQPGKWLTVTCLGMCLFGILLPFSPLAHTLGFVRPPPAYFGVFIVLVTTYIILVELVKSRFLKKYSL